jgi:hypothetical protein
MSCYLAVMKNYAGFRGRAGRREYWMSNKPLPVLGCGPAVPAVGVGVHGIANVQRESGLDLVVPVEQHLAKPVQIGLRVQAIATRTPGAGRQQPDAVVTVQRPHRDVSEAGDLADRVTIHGPTVQPDAT